jgi:hypothetical protein
LRGFHHFWKILGLFFGEGYLLAGVYGVGGIGEIFGEAVHVIGAGFGFGEFVGGVEGGVLIVGDVILRAAEDALLLLLPIFFGHTGGRGRGFEARYDSVGALGGVEDFGCVALFFGGVD